MMYEFIGEASNHINKQQDEWIMDIIVKHCSSDYEGKTLNGFDIVFLQEEFGLKIIDEDNHKNVYVKGELVGYWNSEYEWINDGKRVYLHIDKRVK